MRHLQWHPDSLKREAPGTIGAMAWREGDRVALHWRWAFPATSVVVPADCAPPVRRDELWRSTCFEAFVTIGDGRYCEFNLAPSRDWAAYGFVAYRSGMSDAPVDPPLTAVHWGAEQLELRAVLDLSRLPGFAGQPWRVGISAVITDAAGDPSYAALAHPPGKPDFHHPHCFVIELEAPQRA